jgi:hypothetical protein
MQETMGSNFAEAMAILTGDLSVVETKLSYRSPSCPLFTVD